MKTREKVVLKEQQVLGGKFDKKIYRGTCLGYLCKMVQGANFYGFTERYEKNGENPFLFMHMVHTVTYGCLFSTTRLSFLDRGFIYAIKYIFAVEKIEGQWYMMMVNYLKRRIRLLIL
jgi:oligopeptidase B